MAGKDSNSNSTLAFIIGGLVVAVAVIGWVLYNGGLSDPETTQIKIEIPGVGTVEGDISVEGDATAN